MHNDALAAMRKGNEELMAVCGARSALARDLSDSLR
jgi:hypothetical protein